MIPLYIRELSFATGGGELDPAPLALGPFSPPEETPRVVDESSFDELLLSYNKM
jgi:hypothetical protein